MLIINVPAKGCYAMNSPKKSFFVLLFLLFACITATVSLTRMLRTAQADSMDYNIPENSAIEVVADSDGDYIKWVDFNITCDALSAAYNLDVESYDKQVHLNWIELLAYAGAKSGGSFDQKSVTLIKKLALELENGETTLKELTADMKYYDYYLEAYEAVLGGMVGEYEIEQPCDDGSKTWKKVYGLKAFSPIAKGFPYSDYDDFGSSRSYGYQRQHLGHDMMGQIGTPIRIKYYKSFLVQGSSATLLFYVLLYNLFSQYSIYFSLKLSLYLAATISFSFPTCTLSLPEYLIYFILTI